MIDNQASTIPESLDIISQLLFLAYLQALYGQGGCFVNEMPVSCIPVMMLI
jgi:hypothetical protein